LAQLIARHGDDEARKSPFLADGEITRALVASAHQWVDTLLSTSESKRHEFADVAMAIGRLGQPELVADLQWLLDEDLLRWRQSRDALRDARARGVLANMSDAAHSYVLQYRQAFAAIGGDQIAELMTAYLEDRDFGFDAACVLKAVWDRAQDAPAPSPFKSWPDFSEVKARRSRRAADALAPACPAAEAIFGAIERLVRPEGNSDAQLLAMKLGKIAVSMPYGNKDGIIGALLALPQPVRTKHELVAALLLAGEVINADMILEGVRACIDAEVNHSWMTDQEWWEVERWLELLPFTDRPTATVDGLAIVNAVMSHPRRMDHVVSALRDAPGAEAEGVLEQLVRRQPQLVSQYEWVMAILDRGTTSVARMVIDLVCDGSLMNGPGHGDAWSISERIAAVVRERPELKRELLHRYGHLTGGAGLPVIELVLSKVGDLECVLYLIRGYARQGKPLDGHLAMALEGVALDKRPAAGWSGAYNLHPVAVTALRKECFGMLLGAPGEAALGGACLTAIDELRDEHGRAEFEPRHPDVKSGRPWPSEAEMP
jgi:hypothetical protein